MYAARRKTGTALLALLLSAVSIGFAADEKPVVESIEPAEVVALTPFELVLSGSGFAEGARVFVQTRENPARYMAYRPASLTPEEIRVSFGLGFNLRLSERSLFVENPDGSRSEPLVLRVLARRPQSEEPEPEPEAETVESGEEVEETAEPAETVAGPTLLELQPAEVVEASKFSLLLIGEGFVEGAEVVVSANTNAGSYRTPEYGEVAFTAEYLGETLLEVSFDRGFYHEPATREVFVRNPDGGESARLLLAVSRIGKRNER